MSCATSRPSALACWLMGTLLPVAHREAMLGDLIEEYRDIRALSGSVFIADCWFWSQTCRSLPFLFWSVLRTEFASGAGVAFAMYVAMVAAKYAVDQVSAGLVAGHGTAEVIIAPISFALIAGVGGYLTARIRYGAIVTLALMVTLSVVVLILINACPVPVPWWYRPGFLVLAPCVTLAPPAILGAAAWSRGES